MNSVDIPTIVQQQKEFFSTCKTLPVSFRISQLKKLKKLIQENEKLISEALYQDLGKSEFEAYTTEIGIVLEELGLFLKKTKRWSARHHVSDPIAAFPSSSFILPEPHGVSLIISPWNYPFQLAVAPLVAAIATGNCVVIKPSELSTKTSEILEKLINSNFEASYIHVINGDAATSQALLREHFDMIFFTGSPRVGKIVMKAASEHLIPVVLELGGKSPVIVDKGTDIGLTAKRIIWGKSINAGQTCIAPDYVLVEESQQKSLIEAMRKAAIEMFGEDAQKSPDYPRIINETNVLRMQQMMEKGKVEFGGQSDLSKKFVALTIISSPDLQSSLMQEEIFGPILPVISYKTWDDALHFVKSKPKPLALYIFTNNKGNLRSALQQLSAGGVTVNDTIMHFTNGSLPFGGAGFSGIGSYHGKAGFIAFSHMKPVMKRATWLDLPLRYPPFKNKLKLVKLVLK
ncbi:MAG: aldehyde dehydrogenase [Bacteroidetes bacterium]|nr:MAG: aldehyde dehydrogenase [Bacteroidota bacterium]